MTKVALSHNNPRPAEVGELLLDLRNLVKKHGAVSYLQVLRTIPLEFSSACDYIAQYQALSEEHNAISGDDFKFTVLLPTTETDPQAVAIEKAKAEAREAMAGKKESAFLRIDLLSESPEIRKLLRKRHKILGLPEVSRRHVDAMGPEVLDEN
ncbi:MAG: hypothetical protein NVS1B11_31550 [Terriglobales bacterium]